MLPHRGLHVVIGAGVNHQGAADLYLGMLATLRGRLADAERHLLDAQQMHETIGSAWLLARTNAEYAVLCNRRRARGDVERAIELASVTLAQADRLGTPPIAERALHAKLSAQGVDLSDTSQSIHAIASGVGRRSDRLDPPQGTDGSVTLVFRDIVGFTHIVRRLGDIESHRLVRVHNAIVREQVAHEKGYEVELQGDGFLLAFADPAAAARCSIGIMRELERASADGDVELRARIGIHTGPVIRDADKFFGETVIRTYRISDAAGGGEILVSRRSAERLATCPEITLGKERKLSLAGFETGEQARSVEWGT
jgi:class 3 adenylate cyclase